MINKCDECGADFDDAKRLTLCPHDSLMSDADMAQKDAGQALIGKKVRFAHQPEGPAHAVQSVGWNGMVTLADMSGEFAPHIFVVGEAGI